MRVALLYKIREGEAEARLKCASRRQILSSNLTYPSKKMSWKNETLVMRLGMTTKQKSRRCQQSDNRKSNVRSSTASVWTTFIFIVGVPFHLRKPLRFKVYVCEKQREEVACTSNTIYEWIVKRTAAVLFQTAYLFAQWIALAPFAVDRHYLGCMWVLVQEGS